MPLIIDRDSRDKGSLVLSAATDLPTCALATEVGVIELRSAAEMMGGVLLGHGAVDLLMQLPGSGIAHAKLALERQRRQAGLGQNDEVDGQELGRQGLLGVRHERRQPRLASSSCPSFSRLTDLASIQVVRL